MESHQWVVGVGDEQRRDGPPVELGRVGGRRELGPQRFGEVQVHRHGHHFRPDAQVVVECRVVGRRDQDAVPRVGDAVEQVVKDGA